MVLPEGIEFECRYYEFVSPALHLYGRKYGIVTQLLNLALYVIMVYVVSQKTPKAMGAYKW